MKAVKILQICVVLTAVLVVVMVQKYVRQVWGANSVKFTSITSLEDLDHMFQAYDANSGLSDDITIVTSYMDLGTFAKGDYGNKYTPQMYKEWMKIFAKIKNPVFAYFVDDNIEKYFLKIRRAQPKERTKTVKFKRSESWAFSLKPQIEKIISSPEYPKFKPNTVISDYACIMHAKYEMVATTAKRNPFRTKYIAWMDVGLFRDINHRNNSDFTLRLPPDFNQKKVAYTQVGPLMNLSAEDIFKKNHIFVCGCYFVAKTDVMLSWISLYKKSVVHYLEKGLTNTDQQVLYAMTAENKTVLPKVQLYFTKEKQLQWFYLGYLSKKAR